MDRPLRVQLRVKETFSIWERSFYFRNGQHFRNTFPMTYEHLTSNDMPIEGAAMSTIEARRDCRLTIANDHSAIQMVLKFHARTAPQVPPVRSFDYSYIDSAYDSYLDTLKRLDDHRRFEYQILTEILGAENVPDPVIQRIAARMDGLMISWDLWYGAL